MFVTGELLTIENIHKALSELTLFRHYCSKFKEVGVLFNSELRLDKDPSCVINYYNNRLWYKDFGSSDSSMDIWTYIQKRFNCSFGEALAMVNQDFSLGLYSDYLVVPPQNNPRKSWESYKPTLGKVQKEIRVKTRNLTDKDLKYWNQYNISKDILLFYCVEAIEWYSIERYYFKTFDYSYSYYLGTDNGSLLYKIYNPFNKPKWVSNCKSHQYQGFDQLLLTGSTLVITKSLKDVMSLYSMGIPSIAPQSEQMLIHNDTAEKLKKRFDKIFILYDNDSAGIAGSQLNCNTYGFNQIFYNDNYKDTSDHIKALGIETTINLLNTMMIG